jgi:hypothetical protein
LTALLDRQDGCHDWAVPEVHPQPAVLAVDGEFRVDRCHGRRVIPVIMPGDLPTE